MILLYLFVPRVSCNKAPTAVTVDEDDLTTMEIAMVHSAKPASPQPQAPFLTAAVKSTVERGITLAVNDQFEMPDPPGFHDGC